MEEKNFELEVTSSESAPLGEVSVSVVVPDRFHRAAIVAHGAGGNMDTRLLVDIQHGLASRSTAGVRFNFLYSEKRKRTPDRRPHLLACWRSVADWVRGELAPQQLFLAGKSMGGRMASYLVAEGYPCQGLFLLGYPLHPSGKPDELRKDHLPDVRAPMLFVCGTRDPLCRLDLLEPVLSGLGGRAELHLIAGGDHSFRVPKRTKRSEDDVTREIVAAVARWMDSVPPG